MNDPIQQFRQRLANELGIEKTPDKAASLLESHRQLFEAIEGRKLSDEELIDIAISIGREDE
jgi:hypothetical protein